MRRASLRTTWFYPALALLWLGIAAWLWQEQKQQRRQDEESQRAQGRVLIETVASSIRSQSGMAMYQPERLQAILQEVAANPGVLALALFDSEGNNIADAGEVDKLAPSPAGGSLESWTKDSLQLWSAVRIGKVPWHRGPGPGPPGRGLGRRGAGFRPEPRGGRWFLRRFPPNSKYFLTVLLPLESFRQSVATGVRLRLVVAGTTFLLFLAVALAWRASVRSVALQSSLLIADEQNRHLREMNLAASGLAHETKNPLNAVRMAAQTLANASPSSPDWTERLNLIANEVDRLDARINEWLSFSRPCQPKPKPVELTSLFDELRNLISLDAEEKKADLKIEHLNAVVWADREMLRQLLFNLLLNGVQALENAGHLQVTVQPGRDGKISILVEDSGVGVPAEHRDRLFTPYFTTRKGGTGLGLAISRQIALAHAWHLRYEPRVPRGSAFIVEGISLLKEK